MLIVDLVATVREASNGIGLAALAGFAQLLSPVFIAIVQGYQLQNAGRKANQARTKSTGAESFA